MSARDTYHRHRGSRIIVPRTAKCSGCEHKRESDPVAVIDPANAEQVWSAFGGNGLRERIESLLRVTVSDAQAGAIGAYIMKALDDFANPTPRIEEPTGLGAVVEGDDGELYVRAPQRDGVDWRGTGMWIYKDWQAINAVRVLSEGVKAGESE